MIVDFSVQNYRSIKGLETLAMNAASIVSRNKQLEATNLIPFSSKLSLLKTKALYGANASGKSTMLRALGVFVNVVVNSVKDEKILNKFIDSFRLSGETYLSPTYFQLSFICNNVHYRYGFEATKDEIRSEWLFGTPGKKEVRFFTREGSEIQVNENQFQEGAKVIDLYKQSDNDIGRKNSLFLTVVRSFNQGLAKEIIDYISHYIIISGLSDYQMLLRAELSMGNEIVRKKMAELLKLADTGIEDIIREEYIPENSRESNEKRYITMTRRKGFDKHGKPAEPVDLFMITMESEGTKKMFEISPALLESLEGGRVLILDEFDARFHPLLSRKIVELYNSAANKKAQLIFATHDTNLLTPQLLRRDQVCFVEKDQQGASHFYSLADFKGVRNDASFEKDYIAGKYGAIPFLGDFTTLFEE
jgi:AAA15 family ATPase/GTPase